MKKLFFLLLFFLPVILQAQFRVSRSLPNERNIKLTLVETTKDVFINFSQPSGDTFFTLKQIGFDMMGGYSETIYQAYKDGKIIPKLKFRITEGSLPDGKNKVFEINFDEETKSHTLKLKEI